MSGRAGLPAKVALDPPVGRLVNEDKERTMANMIPLPLAKPDDAKISVSNTGFTFGALTVDRVCTLPKGGAAVRLETPKMALNIRVTKTGKMIVTTDAGMEVLVTR